MRYADIGTMSRERKASLNAMYMRFRPKQRHLAHGRGDKKLAQRNHHLASSFHHHSAYPICAFWLVIFAEGGLRSGPMDVDAPGGRPRHVAYPVWAPVIGAAGGPSTATQKV